MCQLGKAASCWENSAVWEECVYFTAQSLREVAQKMHDNKSGLVACNARLFSSRGLAHARGIFRFIPTTSSKPVFVENHSC